MLHLILLSVFIFVLILLFIFKKSEFFNNEVTCDPGFIMDSETHMCIHCPANTFSKQGDTTCTPCPTGTGSTQGSSSCIPLVDDPNKTPCPPGHALINGTCTPCPENTYSIMIGTVSLCMKCPENMTSPAGSDFISDCK